MMWLFLAFRNLFRNVRRTAAIVGTVAVGTGALFSFDGFIHGVLEELTDSTIHTQYGFGQITTKGYRDTVFEEPEKHWISDPQGLEEFLRQVDGVGDVFPRVGFSALLKHGSTAIGGAGLGIEAEREAQFFHGLNIVEGEPLGSSPNGILLGKTLARALHARPGDEITVIATSTKGKINKGTFVVSGLFATGLAEFDRRAFRVPLAAAQKLLKTASVESVSLSLKSLSDWESAAGAVHAAFPHLEATPFDVLDKIYYRHSVDWLNAQFRVVQVIILSIVLLGIFNTVSASILERKQEIGNMRANGESVFGVMRLILAEGAFLGTLGSLLGMAGAYSFLMSFINKGLLMPPGPGQTNQFLVTFSFEGPMVLSTLATAAAAAIAASLFAGWKAARMPIANALRSH